MKVGQEAPVTVREGIRYLRRRTVWRAVRSFLKWVGQAIGWSYVAYVAFFFVAFVISGLDEIPRLREPYPIGVIPPPTGLGVSLFILIRIVFSRRPPVTLNRKDLYRLALAPVPPLECLRWPLARNRLGYGTFGLIIGLIWSVLTVRLFGVATPWAGPALMLFAISFFNLSWLNYSERQRGSWSAGIVINLLAVSLSMLTFLDTGMGLLAAVYSGSPLSLLPPLLLFLLSTRAVRSDLRGQFPPLFASQCFILGEIRSLVLASYLTGSIVDLDRMRSIYAQLRGKTVARKPGRSIPPFPAKWGRWAPYAWRSTLLLYRRSIWGQLGLLALIMMVSFTGIGRSAGPIGWISEVLLTGFLISRLIGPGLPRGTLPTQPLWRTVGRVLPGSLVASYGIAAFLILPVIIGPMTIGTMIHVVTLPLLGLLLLEKISFWTGMSHTKMEVLFGASFLAMIPTLILGSAFPGLVVGIVNIALCSLVLYVTV